MTGSEGTSPLIAQKNISRAPRQSRIEHPPQELQKGHRSAPKLSREAGELACSSAEIPVPPVTSSEVIV